MLNRPLARATALLVVFALAGCAPQMVRRGPTAGGPKHIASVTAPSGWLKLAEVNGLAVFTRDGAPIQSIVVQQRTHKDFFQLTKQTLAEGALPQEVADAVVAENRAAPGRASLVLMSNEPATIDSQPAFRAHLQYRNNRGAPYEAVLTGFSRQGEIYLISYNALARNFFKRDLEAFDALVKGVKIEAVKAEQ
jgi:hypothetical protein